MNIEQGISNFEVKCEANFIIPYSLFGVRYSNHLNLMTLPLGATVFVTF